MFSLFRKEIISFFGSVTGYLVAFVFLIVNGAFLWIFPGNYNLLENGYATLDSYFSLAPWVFLFLVPALTMRLIADEKRQGTLELLVTRPLSMFQLLWAKYLAGLTLVIICLAPTLIYFYSIYQLGNPVGNWDSGAAWGSFTGLFFLAALYVAIGLFASALTDNQIFSFLLALLLSFLFYAGLGILLSMGFSSGFSNTLSEIGMMQHYLSLGRGVIDSRDVVYFVLMTLFFLYLSRIFLLEKRRRIKRQLAGTGFFALGLVLLFFLSSVWYFRIDLTSEKRYSLAPVSKQIIHKLQGPVQIDLCLNGNLPPGFRRLKQAIEEKAGDMDAFSRFRIHCETFDPYDVEDADQRNKLFDRLVSQGIQPINLRLTQDEGTATHLIFPGAIIHYQDQVFAVNFLKNNPSLSSEVNLNNSVETIEYELVRALQHMEEQGRPALAFLKGQGELDEMETYDIRSSLAENYTVIDRSAEELFTLPGTPKVLVIADPSKAFQEEDKFYIDQYLMRGGNILWMIDPVQVSLDSLSRGESTLAFPRDLNLLDQLFRYGVRINPELVQSVDCMIIPVNTAPSGSNPVFSPAPWYYSPLLIPSEAHELSRNLNRLESDFVSSVDTVGHDPAIRKSVILHTSDYSRLVRTPAEISLQSINNPPERDLFQLSHIPVGVLLEGQFTSVFKNRLTQAFNKTGVPVLQKSKPARMIVLADGDLIANKVSHERGKPQPLPLGYDNYSRQTFGNKDFLINTINYLCDENGIMSLRSRAFQIRLLDKVKIREDKIFWQFLNVAGPLVFILILGILFNFLRSKRGLR